MRRIHADLHPRAVEFDHHRVGPIGGMLLLAIGEREPIDIGALVQQMGRDKSQISRLVQTLERKGLITKEQSIDDGRVSLLRLTEAGGHQLRSIQAVLMDVVFKVMEPLSDREQAAFSQLLDKILTSRNRDAD